MQKKQDKYKLYKNISNENSTSNIQFHNQLSLQPSYSQSHQQIINKQQHYEYVNDSILSLSNEEDNIQKQSPDLNSQVSTFRPLTEDVQIINTNQDDQNNFLKSNFIIKNQSNKNQNLENKLQQDKNSDSSISNQSEIENNQYIKQQNQITANKIIDNDNNNSKNQNQGNNLINPDDNKDFNNFNEIQQQYKNQKDDTCLSVCSIDMSKELKKNQINVNQIKQSKLIQPHQSQKNLETNKEIQNSTINQQKLQFLSQKQLQQNYNQQKYNFQIINQNQKLQQIQEQQTQSPFTKSPALQKFLQKSVKYLQNTQEQDNFKNKNNQQNIKNSQSSLQSIDIDQIKKQEKQQKSFNFNNTQDSQCYNDSLVSNYQKFRYQKKYPQLISARDLETKKRFKKNSHNQSNHDVNQEKIKNQVVNLTQVNQDVALKIYMNIQKIKNQFILKTSYWRSSLVKQIQYDMINDLSVYTGRKGLNNKAIFKSSNMWLAKYLQQDMKIPCFNTLDPSSSFFSLWDIIITFSIFYVLFLIPIQAVTLKQFVFIYDWYYNCSITVFIVFLLDLLLKFNTGYYDKGQIEMNRVLLVQRYLKSSFVPDLICLISVYDSLNSTHKYENILAQLLCYLVLWKVKSIYNIFSKYMEALSTKTSKVLPTIIKLLRLFFGVLFAAHIIAIIFLAIYKYENLNYPEKVNWMSAYDETYVLEDKWLDQYLLSFYWSITTMTTVGYGDLAPKNPFENFIITFLMFIACFIFAYCFNLIGVIVDDLQRADKIFIAQMQLVARYFQEKKITKSLQQEIKRYLEYKHLADGKLTMFETKEVLEKLPGELRSKLVKNANLPYLKQIPAFKSFSEDFLEDLSLQMAEVQVINNQVIFQDNDIPTKDDNSIYFILSGDIHITKQIKNHSVIQQHKDVFITLKQDAYFGELSFFTSSRRTATAVAFGTCHLLVLKKQQFLDTIQNYKKDWECYRQMYDISINNSSNKFAGFGIKCPSCRLPMHGSFECPKLHFIPDNEKIILKHLYPTIIHYSKRYKRREERAENPKSIQQSLEISIDYFWHTILTEEDLDNYIRQNKLNTTAQEQDTNTNKYSKFDIIPKRLNKQVFFNNGQKLLDRLIEQLSEEQDSSSSSDSSDSDNSQFTFTETPSNSSSSLNKRNSISDISIQKNSINNQINRKKQNSSISQKNQKKNSQKMSIKSPKKESIIDIKKKQELKQKFEINKKGSYYTSNSYLELKEKRNSSLLNNNSNTILNSQNNNNNDRIQKQRQQSRIFANIQQKFQNTKGYKRNSLAIIQRNSLETQQILDENKQDKQNFVKGKSLLKELFSQKKLTSSKKQLKEINVSDKSPSEKKNSNPASPQKLLNQILYDTKQQNTSFSHLSYFDTCHFQGFQFYFADFNYSKVVQKLEEFAFRKINLPQKYKNNNINNQQNNENFQLIKFLQNAKDNQFQEINQYQQQDKLFLQNESIYKTSKLQLSMLRTLTDQQKEKILNYELRPRIYHIYNIERKLKPLKITKHKFKSMPSKVQQSRLNFKLRKK